MIYIPTSNQLAETGWPKLEHRALVKWGCVSWGALVLQVVVPVSGWEWLLQLAREFGTKAAVEWLLLPGLTFVILFMRRVWSRWLNGDTNRRLERARVAVNSGNGLWLTKPVSAPSNYELLIRGSIPIITLANLKGGVGKSTITANLAAYFCERGERVLVIDLDFQGSLSSMILGDDAKRKRPAANVFSNASDALSGTKDADWLIAQAWPFALQPKLFALTAFYDLARTENRLLIEWLIEDQPLDMPYNLAKLLTSRRVQAEYDRILIDAPPRLSTACVQALCASTHVLIPTVMDGLSTEAVSTFINEVENLKQGQLCPYIRYAGIVGSMTPTGLVNYHRPIAIALRDRLASDHHSVDIFPEDCWVSELPALGRAAGQTVAYINPFQASDRKAIHSAFDSLGAEVARRIPRRG